MVKKADPVAALNAILEAQNKVLKMEKTLLEMADKRVKKQVALADLKDAELDSLDIHKAKYAAINEEIQHEIAARRKSMDFAVQQAGLTKEEAQKIKELNDEADKQDEKNKEQWNRAVELKKEAQLIGEEALERQEKLEKSMKSQLKDQMEIWAAAIEANKEFGKRIKAAERLEGHLEGAAEKMGIMVDEQKMWGAGFLKTVTSLKGAGDIIKGVLLAFGTKVLLGMFDTVVVKMIEASFKLAWEFSNLTAEVSRTTGQLGKYNQAIADTRDRNTDFAVTFEEAAAAMASLHTEMADFVFLGKEASAGIKDTAVQLGALGVSTDSSAKAMNIMRMTMEQSLAGTEAMSKELAVFAATIGKAPSEVFEDFNASMSTLAVYGADAKGVFMELEEQSKATGIAMDTLLGITAQFDTFEGAATAAGKLNAALGGGLIDSVEMLSMTEDERIKKLQDVMRNSEKQWEDMGKYERRFFMSTLGIQDATVASQLFGEQTAENTQHLENAKAVAAQTGEDWHKLAGRSHEAISAQKMWGEILSDFAVFMEPFAIGLRGLATVIRSVTTLFRKTAWAAPLFGVLATAATLAGLVLTVKFAVGAKAAVSAMVDLGKAVAKQGVAVAAEANVEAAAAAKRATTTTMTELNSTVTTKNTLTKTANTAASWKMVAASAAAAAAIGIVVIGVIFLVRELNKSGDAMKVAGGASLILVSAFVGLALVMFAIGKAGEAAALGLAAAAGPIMAIGGAVTLVLAGVAAVVYSMGLLIQTAGKNAEVMGELVGFVAILGASMIAMSLGGAAAATGLLAMAYGAGALALSLAFIKTDDLLALAVIFENLSKSTSSMGSFARIAGSMAGLTSIIGDDFVALGSSMNAMGEKLTQASLVKLMTFSTLLTDIANVSFDSITSGLSTLSSAVSAMSSASATVDVEYGALGALATVAGPTAFNSANAQAAVGRNIQAKTVATNSILKSISETTKTVSKDRGGGGGNNGKREIVIEMDQREFARAVIDVFERDNDKKSNTKRD